MVDVTDIRSDEGFRTALREIRRAGSWEVPHARLMLEELRRRAEIAARHLRSRGEVSRGGDRMRDELLSAAWVVVVEDSAAALAADSPWMWVIRAAQRAVRHEHIAEQKLTSTSRVRSKDRVCLPSHVNPMGASGADVAATVDDTGHRWHGNAVARTGAQDTQAGLAEFVSLLGRYGADPEVTAAAVRRLLDEVLLPERRYRNGGWRTHARRDPVLRDLGLSPDQCSALVSLVAGSRSDRRAECSDSVFAAVVLATRQETSLELSDVQVSRMSAFAAGATKSVKPQRLVPTGVSQLALFAA